MGTHLIDGEFQSDKYPTCPRGKVPLSVKDETAQDLLWRYAQRRRSVDAEFSDDLEEALLATGFVPKMRGGQDSTLLEILEELGEYVKKSEEARIPIMIAFGFMIGMATKHLSLKEIVSWRLWPRPENT